MKMGNSLIAMLVSQQKAQEKLDPPPPPSVEKYIAWINGKTTQVFADFRNELHPVLKVADK
jgi:hypothetical protein